MFTRNVGGFDRAARIVAGPVLLLVAFLLLGGPHGAGLLALIVGLLLLTSGVVGFCPPYVLFGISTACRHDEGAAANRRAGAEAARR